MIELICGPMFSGKSTTLFSKIERSLFAGKKVLVITPCIDTRSYFTHGQESTTKDTFKERLLSIAKKAKMKPTIDFIDLSEFNNYINFDFSKVEDIFIDEYFMIKNNLWLIKKFPEKRIYFAGLITRADGKLFEEAVSIIPFCERIIKINGVCMECGAEASMTYLKDKKIVEKKGVYIGGDKEYECLCLSCWLKKMEARDEY